MGPHHQHKEKLLKRPSLFCDGHIKPLVFIALLLLLQTSSFAADTKVKGDTESEQWLRIAERMRVEMGITNYLELTNMPLMRNLIVHPAFGIYWDEIPSPTLTNSNAMASVNAFIVTNGWNMETGGMGRSTSSSRYARYEACLGKKFMSASLTPSLTKAFFMFA